MKLTKLMIFLFLASSLMVLSACGGGGDYDSYGEVAIDVTDAKPLLPEGATNLWITFSEVLAHSSGGAWESLPIPETPYTIDLLQFSNGETTELVPPVLLRSGKYTQIRLVLDEEGANIRFNDNDEEKYPVVIPPEHLKTDKNFDINVENGGAVDIVIDFDLSQSLVVTDDGSGTLSYKLKPVLHIVDAFEAATITGLINYGSFVDAYNAIVTVFLFNPNLGEDGDYEEYTKVEVQKPDEEETTEFSIFWLAPNQDYKVEIDFDPDSDKDIEFSEKLDGLDPGEIRNLNGNDPIY